MNRFVFIAVPLTLVACVGSAPTVDGGRCVGEPISATCGYSGYGSECSIACDFPSNCTFDVGVAWTGGGYCCLAGGDTYTDCVCDHGMVLCPRYPGGLRSRPSSTCEFCNTDTGVDPTRDGGPPDSGLCTAEPLTASCDYRGYGTMCPVACDFPETCTFDVAVSWTGSYCCGPGNTDYFTDCVCTRGTAFCRSPWASTDAPLMVPSTNCEFCEPEDAGVDAAIEDAGLPTVNPDAASN